MKQFINNYNQKKSLKHLENLIKKINAASPKISEIINSGKSYADVSNSFKERVSSGESLDSILPEAFALCQLASESIMGMKHYDVQLMGGLSLHKGSVAEMKTGEGKTLVATLPAFLNALTGRQVHIVTVNDYLAKRDSELMRPIYEGLGLTVGHIESSMENDERMINYDADVLYATSSQLGFDYLRDNMAMDPEEILQKKGLYFAIVDEIDSILIDDARTPLIISGQAELNESVPTFMHNIVGQFTIHWWNDKDKIELADVKKDLVLDEKKQDAKLTEFGFEKLENILIENNVITSEGELYTPGNLMLVNAFTTAAKANYLYKREMDYLIHDGKIKIVNQSTGRIEEGRRWSDGLHQAVEVKENVEIKPDSQTMGSVSLQNFFRLYDKLSGMSGTAYSESEEFGNVYGMGVVCIPTHRPVARKDFPDEIFINQRGKLAAILKDIESKRTTGQPVLVGTSSVEESDLVSNELKKNNIPHRVLNAKNHEFEADIIAEAGRPGAVTIATNMAGRGTDILLGGSLKDMISRSNNPDDETSVASIKALWKASHKKVLNAGGLYVIGTSRNESRRVDNQLIGRAGRQGDPGASKFYVSFEDKIMRLFGDGKYNAAIRAMGLTEDNGISHPLINRAIQKSQEQIDAHHSNMRKELLKFDDISNLQRKAIYEMRREALFGDGAWLFVYKMSRDVLDVLKEKYTPHNSFVETWDVKGMELALSETFNIEFDLSSIISADNFKDEEHIFELLDQLVKSSIDYWLSNLDEEIRNSVAKQIFLITIDKNWREQINSLEQLRDGIHLRGYAQKNPLQEYGKDALGLFEIMIGEIKREFVQTCFLAFPDLIKQRKDADDAFLQSIEESE